MVSLVFPWREGRFGLRFAGVDPSYDSTGVVILDSEGKALHQGTIKAKGRGLLRVAALRDALLDMVEKAGIDVVAVEGYAFAKRTAGAHQSGELGGVVRLALYESGISVIDVPPTTLKKFVTGRGNARKEEVVLEVYKRWGVSCTKHDEADAYGLAQFARSVFVGRVELTSFQREALSRADYSLCPAVKNSVRAALLKIGSTKQENRRAV